MASFNETLSKVILNLFLLLVHVGPIFITAINCFSQSLKFRFFPINIIGFSFFGPLICNFQNLLFPTVRNNHCFQQSLYVGDLFPENQSLHCYIAKWFCLRERALTSRLEKHLLKLNILDLTRVASEYTTAES